MLIICLFLVKLKLQALYKECQFLKGLLCLKSWWDHLKVHISKLTISVIFKSEEKNYSVVLLFMMLVPPPLYFGYRKNHAALDLIHVELHIPIF